MSAGATETTVGELISAAFDAAATDSRDPWEVACLATMAVQNILRRSRRAGAPADESPLYATLCGTSTRTAAYPGREELPRFPGEHARVCAQGSDARSFRRPQASLPSTGDPVDSI